MKKTLFAFAMIFSFIFATLNVQALTSVKGYYRKNGTYVQPHYRTSPNNTTTDNFSYNGYKTTGMSYGEASALESSLRKKSTTKKAPKIKLSKREKKVQKCMQTGKTELQCKAIYMPKKK